MIEKSTRFGHIEVTEDRTIFLKQYNEITEDGKTLLSSPHRICYAPGSDISEAHEEVKKAASIYWNSEVIEEYKAKSSLSPKP